MGVAECMCCRGRLRGALSVRVGLRVCRCVGASVCIGDVLLARVVVVVSGTAVDCDVGARVRAHILVATMSVIVAIVCG